MFYIGVDLGQKRDHSAIKVVERWDAGRGYEPPAMRFLDVRHMERVPLGTPYTVVAARVKRLVQDSQLAGQVALAVDATGVGTPVVDLMRSARMGCDIAAVSITGGDKETQSGGVYNVPKKDLIAGVQLLLEKGQLRIAKKMPEAWALVKELLDVRMTAGRGPGRVKLGADGGGEHDDLVIALALGCWRACWKRVGHVGYRLPGI